MSPRSTSATAHGESCACFFCSAKRAKAVREATHRCSACNGDGVVGRSLDRCAACLGTGLDACVRPSDASPECGETCPHVSRSGEPVTCEREPAHVGAHLSGGYQWPRLDRPDYAPPEWPLGESIGLDATIERACHLLGKVWEHFDPHAHEPNDCFCGKATFANRPDQKERFRSSSQALQWVEMVVEQALAAAGRKGTPAPDHAPVEPGLLPVGTRVREKETSKLGIVIMRPPPRYVRVRFDDDEPGGGHMMKPDEIEVVAEQKRSDGT